MHESLLEISTNQLLHVIFLKQSMQHSSIKLVNVGGAYEDIFTEETRTGLHSAR